MTASPVLVVDIECTVGEGPLWHPKEQALYWVDIVAGRIYRHDPAVGGYEMILETEVTGGFTFQQDGGLLLFQDKGAIRHWKNGIITTLFEQIDEEVDSRFNDVATDPMGRVFCGTMNTESRPGRLYRLDHDGSLGIVFEDAGLSNGIAWSPDRTWMYHSDSLNRNVTRSRYDLLTGDVSDREIWFELEPGTSVPDGMTVDATGFIWLAVWDGNVLLKINPAGEIVDRIAFPVRKVSSVTFGGPNLDKAYVTTASTEGRELEGAGAGGVFKVELGVTGLPEAMSGIVE